MSSESSTAGHLDIGGVFEATTEIYKKSFGTVWLVALALLLPAAIIVWLLGDSGFGGFLGSLVNLVATAWLVGAVIRVVQDVEQDGKVDWSVGEILGSVTSKLVWIILLQIVLGILIAIGLVFFIIPGVILALMWIVAMPALVVEDRGVFDSMSRSSDLTRHNRMRILGIGIVIVLVYVAIVLVGALLVAAIPVVGIILLVALGVALFPYIAIIAAVLFYRLVELKEGVVVAVEETGVVEESADAPPTPGT
jgi:hypothetical protein